MPAPAVDIWDVANGALLSTYALAGSRGSDVVCINAAAAHLVPVGDTVIIGGFVISDDGEASA